MLHTMHGVASTKYGVRYEGLFIMTPFNPCPCSKQYGVKDKQIRVAELGF